MLTPQNMFSAHRKTGDRADKNPIRGVFFVLLAFYLLTTAAGVLFMWSRLAVVNAKMEALAMAQESLGRRADLKDAIDSLRMADALQTPESERRAAVSRIAAIVRECYDCHHTGPVQVRMQTLENDINKYRVLDRRLHGRLVSSVDERLGAVTNNAFAKAVSWSKASAQQVGRELHAIRKMSVAAGSAGLVLFMGFSAVTLRRISRLIAEARKAHVRIVQSEKMASLGRMVAGAAHELNNPLTAVIGYCPVLTMSLTDDKTRQIVDTINKAAQRMAVIIRDLLTFSRTPVLEIRPVRVKDFITESLKAASESAAAAEVTVSVDAAPDLVALMDRPHMEQVLVNLVTNAAQAIKDSGRGDRISVKACERDDAFFLEVSDNGPGIPGEIKDKIFEPFFTTKRPGRGTGLGLSICYAIVEAHNGSLRVNSTEGAGTAFVIELPRTPSPGERAA